MVARSDSVFDQEPRHGLAFNRVLGVTVTELEARRVMESKTHGLGYGVFLVY